MHIFPPRAAFARPVITRLGQALRARSTEVLADQTDPDWQIKIDPHAISGENLGGSAADCQGEAAAVYERQTTSTIEGAHRAGQFGVRLGDWFDRDSGGGEQLPDPAGVDIGVYKLSDNFGQIRRSQGGRMQLGGNGVGARLIMNKREDS